MMKWVVFLIVILQGSFALAQVSRRDFILFSLGGGGALLSGGVLTALKPFEPLRLQKTFRDPLSIQKAPLGIEYTVEVLREFLKNQKLHAEQIEALVSQYRQTVWQEIQFQLKAFEAYTGEVKLSTPFKLPLYDADVIFSPRWTVVWQGFLGAEKRVISIYSGQPQEGVSEIGLSVESASEAEAQRIYDLFQRSALHLNSCPYLMANF